MSAQDVLSIQQLAVTYADALSRGDVARAAATFAEDGRLETPTGEPAVGQAAIRAAVAQKVSTLELIFQTVHLGLVTVTGDRATASFPITEWERRTEDARPFLFLGWYDDELLRYGDAWRFARRRLVPRIFAQPEFMSSPLHPL